MSNRRSFIFDRLKFNRSVSAPASPVTKGISFSSTLLNNTIKTNTNVALQEDLSLQTYELQIEFANLKDCSPLDIYLMPAFDFYTLNGFIYLKTGLYKGGLFEFVIEISKDYPRVAPIVKFETDLIHPLIDKRGLLRLFEWDVDSDHIVTILKYIKQIFKTSYLSQIEPNEALNKEALDIFFKEKEVFTKLAGQSAIMSTMESTIYNSKNINKIIKFSPISDSKLDEIMKNIGISNS